MNPFIRIGAVLAFFALTNAFGPARAATVGTWYEVHADGGQFSITYKSRTYDLAASPTQHLEDQVWYYNANLVPQDASNMQANLEQQYGLLAGSLLSIGKCDDGTACTSGATRTDSGSVSTFTSTVAFDYLAVHLGSGELFFSWAMPTNTFTLSGLPSSSISNYQAFLGPAVIATPLPAAFTLFLSSLLAGMAWLRRGGRRLAAAA